MIWSVYRGIVRGLSPVLALYLARRVARGKEHKSRLPERWGHAGQLRPTGSLIWLHAASVGESVSLLPLIDRLLALRTNLTILVTTGTLTSARMMQERLPVRTLHQFVPIDHPTAARRFLSHWRPDVAIWVESELWPTLLLETRKTGIKMALVNARLSDRSFKGWQRLQKPMARLLNCFDLILAQDPSQAARLRSLGAKNVDSVGDLKSAVSMPAPDPAILALLRHHLQDRPVWLAASTHPGEEDIAGSVHLALKHDHPNLLTIIAPRHPARGDAVAAQLADRGFTLARRSRGEIPDVATDLWLIDNLGEMGLFYRLVPLALVAGSMGLPGSIGGHNPIEAASVGCAILYGPDTENAAASTALLNAAGAAIAVRDTADLIEAVGRLLADPERLRTMGHASLDVVASERKVLDAIVARLQPLLPRADDASA